MLQPAVVVGAECLTRLAAKEKKVDRHVIAATVEHSGKWPSSNRDREFHIALGARKGSYPEVYLPRYSF